MACDEGRTYIVNQAHLGSQPLPDVPSNLDNVQLKAFLQALKEAINGSITNPVVPAAIRNFTAAEQPNGIQLSWSPDAKAKYYQIYEGPTNEFNKARAIASIYSGQDNPKFFDVGGQGIRGAARYYWIRGFGPTGAQGPLSSQLITTEVGVGKSDLADMVGVAEGTLIRLADDSYAAVETLVAGQELYSSDVLNPVFLKETPTATSVQQIDFVLDTSATLTIPRDQIVMEVNGGMLPAYALTVGNLVQTDLGVATIVSVTNHVEESTAYVVRLTHNAWYNANDVWVWGIDGTGSSIWTEDNILSFLGWNNTASSLNQAANQNVNDISENTLYYAIGVTLGGSTQNFRFALKSAPTSWTTPTGPYTTFSVTSVLGSTLDQDKIYVGYAQAADARVYRYNIGANTFTNLSFPTNTTHSSIRDIKEAPNDNDLLLVATQNEGASSSASIYSYRISTTTWTLLHAFSTGSADAVLQIAPYQGKVYATLAGGATNVAQLYVSTVAPYTSWTQIAGDGVNGSWATGTKRGLRIAFSSTNIYAGLSGTAAGDGEAWMSSDLGASWTQIGGAGLNGSWATGTKTSCAAVAAYGNKVAFGTGGTGASDAEVWQFDEATTSWVQIGGDSINSSWASKKVCNVVYVDADQNLLVGCGDNSASTSALYLWPPVVA